jgi:site-specific DNA-methyltransferase (adenine-specific)
MEDAGLIIHPAIGWLFGSGFPKATRIDTQIDKAEGVEVSRGKAHPAFAPRGVGYRSDEFQTNGHSDGSVHSAQSDLAKAWAGHRYGLQAMKPSFEFIAVAQVPYKGKPVECITKTGAGALNIDAGRIGTPHTYTPKGCKPGGSNLVGVPWDGGGQTAVMASGRWPSNLAMGRRERDLGLDGFAEQPAWNGTESGGGLSVSAPHLPIRNGHPTVKPIRLTRWLASLLLPPAEYAPRRILVPFSGSGSECIGALLAGWDEVQGVEGEEEYANIARARCEFWQGNSGLFALLTEPEPEADPQEVLF